MKYTVILLLISILCACDKSGDLPGTLPDVVRVGVLPDQSVAQLKSDYEPLLAYLQTETNLEFELIIPQNYQNLLNQFDDGKLDLVWFGGLTFVRAENRSQAEPLVMRDIDRQFTSCYLVDRSDPRHTVAEFAGESFAFGPRLSTSGHLMPRHFLERTGIVPEQLFSSVRYSTGHDQTAAWVTEGTVTIAVANCVIAQSKIGTDESGATNFRILGTTPTYANYVWAVRRSLDPAVKTALRDAFLALDATMSEHRALMQPLGAGGFLPAGHDDFEDVRAAASATGLLN